MPQPGLLWEETEDRKVLSAPGLKLVFTQAEDRWTHRLELNGSADVIAWPLEVDAEKADPASIVGPVFQEIHPHEIDGGPGTPLCVLVTGRLFDHQFSAVVTVSLDPETPGGSVFDWDLADRCRTPVSHLAATYNLPLNSGELADAGEQSIVWSGERLPGGRLEFQADPPGNVALAEAGRNGTRVQAVAKVDPKTFTHRLRYRWVWRPDPDVATRSEG